MRRFEKIQTGRVARSFVSICSLKIRFGISTTNRLTLRCNGKLAALSGIPQSTISAIENNRVNLGIERAKVLARVLQVRPAVLVFPGWDVDRESAA